MKEWVLLGRERENESEFVSSVARHDEFEMGSHRIAFMMWYLVIKFDSNVCLADDDGGEEERKGSKTGWVSWGSNVANPTQQHGFLFLFNAIKSFAKVFSSTFLLICYIIRSFVISIFYIFYLSFAICLLVSNNSLSLDPLSRHMQNNKDERGLSVCGSTMTTSPSLDYDIGKRKNIFLFLFSLPPVLLLRFVVFLRSFRWLQ